ncbi:glycosyl hydrolase family 28 protein [Arachidicoccus sp.]|uniref:glycosyl hydrolase family 28 protein n=1 Tax=Arachidicoccus sp. TaxID=1872624 RepID=UPI003D1A1330
MKYYWSLSLHFSLLLLSVQLFGQKVLPARNLVIPVASVTSNSATLLWDKPIEYKYVKSYQIFQDGKKIGESDKTNFIAKNLRPDKTYSFSIKAENNGGILSAMSSRAECKTQPQGKVFNIKDFGAKGDGVTKNTTAIQKAIDACTKNGTVLIPSGIFLSGALHLKSNMTLLIAKGGILKGSEEINDYEPFIKNRFEGWELKTFASLLNAGTLDRSGKYNVVNLRICGEGTILGGGTALGNAMIKKAGLRGRGRLICIMNGENIEIQGLNVENSPCWTIHYIYSKNVVLHDLNIVSTASNGDGIDPDSSIDSYIFNCTFSTGDDCIAIKSGKNPEGYFIGKASKNIRITDCNFVKGHSLAIGSEMSGGVSDVFIQDCKIGNLLHGLQIKATKDRGGYVRNVIVRDCDLLQITLYTAVNYNNDGAPAPEIPLFSNMEFSNLNLSAAKPNAVVMDINGFKDQKHYTQNILFQNIVLPEKSIIQIKNCASLTFKDIICKGGEKPQYRIVDSRNIIH